MSIRQGNNIIAGGAESSSGVKDVKVNGTSVVTDDVANIDLTGKQDTISDLESIRSGADAGSTAIQPNDNISELTNNANYQNDTQVSSAISTHNTDTTAHSDIRSAITNGLADKVDKSTTANVIYGTNGSGVQQLHGLAYSSTTAWSIPQRNGNGQIVTADPTANNQAANKSYVDTAVADKSTVSVSATGTTTDEVQYITIDGVEKKLAGGSNIEEDNITITKNTSNKLQTVAVLDNKDNVTALKTWTGTLAEYNAITTKDSNTLYNITDDISGGLSVYTKTEVDALLDERIGTIETALANI